ncbi:MAG: peptidoglycan-associated lipoprotein Pal [Oligoflexales bacterium]|nr:peptidoglycan-associated lipoprotein Pal [Oligoflexales bacterium]
MRNFNLAVMALVLGFIFSNCTDDKKKPEEPVKPAAEAPATPPEQAPAQDVNLKEATSTVYFAYDDYSLSTEAQDSLKKLADYLKKTKSAVVQIEGHCDERGSVEYNLALGQRRAQSVKNFLVQLGIEESRLPTISYGEERPAVEGHDEAAWAKNRRAEFVLSNP